MGNTLIEDSTTGNIMGLRDGFVPVGMRERGGVLYIASYNPLTNEGQLGTIPSPVFNYEYDNVARTYGMDDNGINIVLNNGLSSLIDPSNPLYSQEPILLSDKRFLVGDQFIPILNIDDSFITCRRCWVLKEYPDQDLVNLVTMKYPLITGFKSADSSLHNYGWYNLKLEAKTEGSVDTIELSNINSKIQTYYLDDSISAYSSDYWFIKGNSDLNLDNRRCQASDCYRTYPNILPGYLYIRTEIEKPEGFLFLVNKTTLQRSPNIYLIIE